MKGKMIAKLFIGGIDDGNYKRPFVYWGTGEEDFPEPAIAISHDAGGTVVIQQNEQEILISSANFLDFAKELLKIAKQWEK